MNSSLIDNGATESTTQVENALVKMFMVTEERQDEDKVELKTRSGIPIRFIWLPYTFMAIVFISLMIASFVRFHMKNGHKYRKRREDLRSKSAKNGKELETKGENGIEEIIVTLDGTGCEYKGLTSAPSGIKVDEIKDDVHQTGIQCSTLTSIPKNNTYNQPLSANHITLKQGNSNAQPKEPQRGAFAQPKNHHNSSNDSQLNFSSTPHVIKRKSNHKHNRRKPIHFAWNANGSMVDLRVRGNDSVNMFKSAFQVSSKPKEPLIWTSCMGRKRHPYVWQQTRRQCSTDEDLLLIQQTRL